MFVNCITDWLFEEGKGLNPTINSFMYASFYSEHNEPYIFSIFYSKKLIRNDFLKSFFNISEKILLEPHYKAVWLTKICDHEKNSFILFENYSNSFNSDLLCLSFSQTIFILLDKEELMKFDFLIFFSVLNRIRTNHRKEINFIVFNVINQEDYKLFIKEKFLESNDYKLNVIIEFYFWPIKIKPLEFYNLPEFSRIEILCLLTLSEELLNKNGFFDIEELRANLIEKHLKNCKNKILLQIQKEINEYNIKIKEDKIVNFTQKSLLNAKGEWQKISRSLSDSKEYEPINYTFEEEIKIVMSNFMKEYFEKIILSAPIELKNQIELVQSNLFENPSLQKLKNIKAKILENVELKIRKNRVIFDPKEVSFLDSSIKKLGERLNEIINENVNQIIEFIIENTQIHIKKSISEIMKNCIDFQEKEMINNLMNLINISTQKILNECKMKLLNMQVIENRIEQIVNNLNIKIKNVFWNELSIHKLSLNTIITKGFEKSLYLKWNSSFKLMNTDQIIEYIKEIGNQYRLNIENNVLIKVFGEEKVWIEVDSLCILRNSIDSLENAAISDISRKKRIIKKYSLCLKICIACFFLLVSILIGSYFFDTNIFSKIRIFFTLIILILLTFILLLFNIKI